MNTASTTVYAAAVDADGNFLLACASRSVDLAVPYDQSVCSEKSRMNYDRGGTLFRLSKIDGSLMDTRWHSHTNGTDSGETNMKAEFGCLSELHVVGGGLDGSLYPGTTGGLRDIHVNELGEIFAVGGVLHPLKSGNWPKT